MNRRGLLQRLAAIATAPLWWRRAAPATGKVIQFTISRDLTVFVPMELVDASVISVDAFYDPDCGQHSLIDGTLFGKTQTPVDKWYGMP